MSTPHYERDDVVNAHLAYHYPAPDRDPLATILGHRTPPITERFPFAVADLWEKRPGGRALDIGCACGGMTLALARDFDEAVGLERSPVLLDAALAVARSGRAEYGVTVEGEVRESCDIAVTVPEGVAFVVGDALSVPYASGAFDTVLALDLLDRVADPRRALSEMTRLVAPGGTLIVSAPFAWQERFTPAAHRLGGFLRNGKPVHAWQALPEIVGKRFSLQRELQVPFFMPHGARSGVLGLTWIHVYRRLN
ncbi:methyltransferase domain-containing protein [Planctomycetota bacterium]